MSQSITFYYTGANQSWTVPDRVSSVNLNLLGAQGGVPVNIGNERAAGGQTVATLPVVPGQELTIIVGGMGQDAAGTIGGIGGFGYGHGGAGGTSVSRGGGGGGGATAVIFDGFPLVAGGAAGRAGGSLYLETFGGGLQGGETENITGGRGGTQTAAGSGGVGDISGSDGSGPHGGDGASAPLSPSFGGGGGGGGFWGGGGGAIEGRFGFPGGGGSGYVGSQDGPDYPFLNAQTFSAINNGGDGLVIISYSILPPNPNSISISGRIPVQSLVTTVCQQVSITAQVRGLDPEFDLEGSTLTFQVIGPFATVGELQLCQETPNLVTQVGAVPISSSISSFISSSNVLQVESPAFTPTAAGVYRWRLVYETQGTEISSLCSDNSLIFSVNKVVPSLTRYIGTGYEECKVHNLYGLYALWLSGGCDPQGSIVCHLEYNGSIVYQETINVRGNGIYNLQSSFHVPPFSPNLLGTSIWKCSFMGDPRNYPVTLCFRC